MADLAQLKRGITKGEPPARNTAPRNLDKAPRDKEEPVVALQLKIPQSVADAFSKAAAEKHGYKKGSKSLFFMDLIRDHLEKT